jgi:hypothetical protein
MTDSVLVPSPPAVAAPGIAATARVLLLQVRDQRAAELHEQGCFLDRLGLAREKLVVTVDRHGNTSAASVPLALDEYVRAGKIKAGHRVMLQGVGGGFTWGASLVTI